MIRKLMTLINVIVKLVDSHFADPLAQKLINEYKLLSSKNFRLKFNERTQFIDIWFLFKNK